MRDGVVLYASEDSTEAIGTVTSGGFGPTVEGPVAMGYVASGLAQSGVHVWGEVRGKRLAVEVADLPFVPARFKR
jgi:aminomethyltransferase